MAKGTRQALRADETRSVNDVLQAVPNADYIFCKGGPFNMVSNRNRPRNVSAGANRHRENIVEQIIAGRFQTRSRADAAAAAINCYVERRDLCIFHNNPPGQHGSLKDDGGAGVDLDRGSGAAEESATIMALAAGVGAGVTAGVIGIAGGPVTALAAVGVAAYTGSLIGSLGSSGNNQPSQQPSHYRPAGVILAVRIARQTSKELVVGDLRNGGAEDIEQAEGEWCDGDWVNFNPDQAPHLVPA
jgi:hypothetical protein